MLNRPHLNHVGIALALLAVALLVGAAILVLQGAGDAGGMLDSRWLSR